MPLTKYYVHSELNANCTANYDNWRYMYAL